MIIITVPELVDYTIYRDRYAYTTRKIWYTKAGKERNDVVGCCSTLLSMLDRIEQHISVMSSDNTFTLADLQQLHSTFNSDNTEFISALDKYRTLCSAQWTKANVPDIDTVQVILNTLEPTFRQKSQSFFDFDLFEFTKTKSLVAKHCFNFVVNSLYLNDKGEYKKKAAWDSYPCNLHKLARVAIHSEVFSRLNGNTVDIYTYIATLNSFTKVFCDSLIKTYS